MKEYTDFSENVQTRSLLREPRNHKCQNCGEVIFHKTDEISLEEFSQRLFVLFLGGALKFYR